MRLLWLWFVCGLLALPAHAAKRHDAEPAASSAPTAAEEADAVLVATTTGDADALVALGAASDPDVWHVVNELCVRGEHAAAEALARAAPPAKRRNLSRYVASMYERAPEPKIRTVLLATLESLAHGDYERAWSLASEAGGETETVDRVRLAFARGLALQKLLRSRESTVAFRSAAKGATALGWFEVAAEAYEHWGVSAYQGGAWEEAVEAWGAGLELSQEIGALDHAAAMLNNLAIVRQGLGQTGQALRLLQQAHRIQRERGDEEAVAQSHMNLGSLLLSLGRSTEAAAQLETAYAVADGAGDRSTMAKVLVNQAIVDESLGRFEEALGRLKRAATLFVSLNDQGGAARCLGNQGAILNTVGRYEEALEHMLVSIRLNEARGDRALVGTMLGNAEKTYGSLGRYPEALDFLHRSLRVLEDLGYQRGLQSAHGGLGIVYMDLGRYEEALPHLELALEIAQDRRDSRGIATQWGNIAIAFERCGSYRAALEIFRKALGMYSALGDPEGMARMHANIGVIHDAQGRSAEAMRHHERALAMQEEMGDRAGMAQTLVNLGVTSEKLGRFPEALEHHRKALRLAEDVGDPAVSAQALTALGYTYKSLGQRETALRHLRDALAIFEALPTARGIASARSQIGNVLRAEGAWEEALGQYRQALAAYERLGDAPGIAWTHLNIGNALHGLDRHAAAEEHLQRALASHRALGNGHGCIVVLGSLGDVRRDQGRPEDALGALRDALELLDEHPNPALRARVLGGLAMVHLDAGEAKRAVALAREAALVTTDLLEGLAEEEGAVAREHYSGLVDVGIRAAVRSGDLSAIAFFVEQGRAAALRERLGARGALRDAVIPADLRDELAETQAQERRARQILGAAMRKGARPAIRAALTGLERAQSRVQDQVEHIQRAETAAAQIAFPSPHALPKIQAHLEEGEVLVYYVLLEDEALALVVESEGAHVVSLGATSNLDEAVDDLLSTARPYVHEDAVAPLRSLLVAPLDLADDVTRVLICPAGRLGYVPFGLLWPDRGVVLVPSGTTSALLRSRTGDTGEGILAVGDPDYATIANADVDLLRASAARAGLQPLPGSREEVEAVGDELLLGANATETKFREALAAKPRRRAVHLACHGLVDPDRPLLSSLALTADAENDGFLTCLEVFRLQVPADLVVLSACETGKGRIFRVEGILGLTQAFMHAGAPRVLCSLWKVDDDATRALMVRFYEGWEAGLDAPAALQAAQTYIRSKETWKHPEFWAAWVLWGLP